MIFCSKKSLILDVIVIVIGNFVIVNHVCNNGKCLPQELCLFIRGCLVKVIVLLMAMSHDRPRRDGGMALAEPKPLKLTK